jgi:hypothetical protein
VVGGAADAVPDSLGWPPPVSVPDGDGDPDAVPDWEGDAEGEAEPGDGEPDCGDGDPEPGDGDPDCGDGDPDWGGGEPDWGGGLPEPPVGGGGDCGGWLRKIKIAISTASAASSTISSQETRMVRQPARSYRPGHGSGQSRASPGRTRSIQYCW